MNIKKNGKIINLTESEIKKMIKWLDNKEKQILKEQDIKGIWKEIPSDTTISVSNNNLLVKTERGKLKANYSVTHNKIGDMEVLKVDFDKDSGYLSLTLSIPYGKGIFVKPKIEGSENQEKLKKAGIYANHIEGGGAFTNDKLFLKVNLNSNEKALKAILNATEGKQTIDLGEGFKLFKS